MRAAIFHAYGAPDVLAVSDVADPALGSSQVLVRVSHAGVNFAEVMFRRGQIPVGLPHVPGLEAAGTVVEVGEDVRTIAVGDRVVALTLAGGGNAELVVAEEALTVVLDGALADLAASTAAAAACNVTTAWGAVHAARPVAGEDVLVLAAAGGVGSAIAQLVTRAGGRVTGAVGTIEKRDALDADLFADRVTYDELLAAGLTFDVVFDAVGGPVREALVGRVRALGRYVVFGNAAQDVGTCTFDDVWFSGAALVGYNLGGLAHARPDVLAEHLGAALLAVATGDVVVAQTVVALDDVPEAHARLEGRRTSGKIVVEIGRESSAWR